MALVHDQAVHPEIVPGEHPVGLPLQELLQRPAAADLGLFRLLRLGARALAALGGLLLLLLVALGLVEHVIQPVAAVPERLDPGIPRTELPTGFPCEAPRDFLDLSLFLPNEGFNPDGVVGDGRQILVGEDHHVVVHGRHAVQEGLPGDGAARGGPDQDAGGRIKLPDLGGELLRHAPGRGDGDAISEAKPAQFHGDGRPSDGLARTNDMGEEGIPQQPREGALHLVALHMERLAVEDGRLSGESSHRHVGHLGMHQDVEPIVVEAFQFLNVGVPLLTEPFVEGAPERVHLVPGHARQKLVDAGVPIGILVGDFDLVPRQGRLEHFGGRCHAELLVELDGPPGGEGRVGDSGPVGVHLVGAGDLLVVQGDRQAQGI